MVTHIQNSKSILHHREEPYLPDVASAFVHFPGGALDGLDDLGAGHGLNDEGELVARHAEIHYNFTGFHLTVVSTLNPDLVYILGKPPEK